MIVSITNERHISYVAFIHNAKLRNLESMPDWRMGNGLLGDMGRLGGQTG